MELPTIDLASLPGLDTVTGIFGSTLESALYDDRIVAIMVFVYDTIPPIESLA